MRLRKEYLIVPAVLAADRVLKLLAPRLPEEGMTLIPGMLQLRFTVNRGIAFSLLSGQPRLLGVLSLAVIAGMILFLRKKELKPFPLAALMLMLGGALGNAADRLLLGYVPDMIELLFVRFAVFNAADAALTIGCGMMLISLLLRKNDWAEQTGERKTDDGK
ncbi:MAG: signal peptidase II [Clostridia bacterium]|nr:signal peptidase II [Clostridia bacterium]